MTALARGARLPLPVRALRLAGAVALAALLAHTLGLGGKRLDTFFSAWVYDGVILTSAVLCLLRAVLVRSERFAWACLAAGLLLWSAGEIHWTLSPDSADSTGPGISDALWLSFYPASYLAVVLLVRSRLRGASSRLWLDGIVAALAASCIAAVFLFEPILGSSAEPGSLILTDVAYPVADLLLLAVVTGVFGLTGWRPGRSWALIGAGFVVTAAADGAFLYQAALGDYVDGSLIDALWPASTLLLGWAAWIGKGERQAPDTTALRTLIVPAASALTGLAVLVAGTQRDLNELAVGLATATLLAAILRMVLTFGDNARLAAESSRDALTDALTGLGNRRRLMRDLERGFDASGGGAERTIALFDLDGFKNYNDVFGHPAGDSLLVRLAAALELVVLGRGEAYRLGGDEFCVLLDGVDGAAERLLAACVVALTERGHGFDVGCSHGSAKLPEEATDRTGALKLSDQRLYAEKFERQRDSISEQTCDALLQVLHEREPDLRHHVGDVAELALRVGIRLGLKAESLDDVRRAAELHDVGKSAVPDAILAKPGPLDEREWEFVRQHTLVGERIIRAAPALASVARLVRSSHERFDGKGYPDRLVGSAIPLGARIVAACDAWDAMITTRPYRRAKSHAAALKEMQRCSGTQFDPVVVRALCDEVEMPRIRGELAASVA
jgi:two-component system cell cycle response regulator